MNKAGKLQQVFDDVFLAGADLEVDGKFMILFMKN